MPVALKLYVMEPVEAGIVPIARLTFAYNWLSFENAFESRGLSAELSAGAQLFVTSLVAVLLEAGVAYAHTELVDPTSGIVPLPEHNLSLSGRLALVLRP